jgi:DNA invertase Pin-like site-specific DNA recombinase
MLAAFASFERDLIRERTGEGRKRAMAAGVHFGPKFKLSDYQRAEALKRLAAGDGRHRTELRGICGDDIQSAKLS